MEGGILSSSCAAKSVPIEMKEEESRSGGGSELAEALVKLRGAAADDSVVGVDGGGGYGGVEVELAGAVSRRFSL